MNKEKYYEHFDKEELIKIICDYSTSLDLALKTIDKANKILSNLLVIEDRNHKGNFRPVKNTSSQDVYKAIVMLNEVLETPNRINYNLLQGSDK